MIFEWGIIDLDPTCKNSGIISGENMSFRMNIVRSLLIASLWVPFSGFANDVENLENAQPQNQQTRWYKSVWAGATYSIIGLALIGGASYGIYAANHDNSNPVPSLEPSTSLSKSPLPSYSPNYSPSYSPSFRPSINPSLSYSEIPTAEVTKIDSYSLIVGDNISVNVNLQTSTEDSMIAIVDDIGTLEVSTTSVTFSPIDPNAGSLFFYLPSPTNVTPDLVLTLVEFLLNHLASAAQATTEKDTSDRRLDSPGCDFPSPDLPCTLGCCAAHDKCYADNGCKEESWARTVCEPFLERGSDGVVTLGPIGFIFCKDDLAFISGECNQCNLLAVGCVATGCSGLSDSPDPICYDNKCNRFFECDGECPIFSSDDKNCCGCEVPGENCNSPSTCGNFVCDFGESTSNCYGDCAFNTCDNPGELDCGGTCVDPKKDPDNCGACGIKCFAGSPCVLGSCSIPFSVKWTSSQSGVWSGGGWKVSNDGLTVRFSIEDSPDCGGWNSNIQSGSASAAISVSEAYDLRVLIDGVSELHNTGYENMSIFLNGQKIATSTSRELAQGCTMGASIVEFLVPQPIVLQIGRAHV